ncbi:glutathione S-transferase N-terminal domain-containing protein [Stutzerimonas stutzeri]|uniref:glutathione S-transferase N-terminal domain-containing protein n=1 Tax=Stutzerimonas stutzeri TaxID=316 RepID=UPI00210AAC7A|nr:glutathione S-transferase N-terminal domain-containing protein [Stutzerimonas stutzeri]MCQ4322483.1 glutathione S-transferase [Stutzerimonas stutzeri]
MITLYHCMSARSFRALWALEELGLDYELMMLPFPPRLFKKEYLSINPLGTIPAFFDGDTFMTESSAIRHRPVPGGTLWPGPTEHPGG